MKDVFLLKDNIVNLDQVPSISVYGVEKSMGRKPKFTIAIPTYKRVSTLGQSIESALSQLDFDDYNIIVVDNNPERNDATELFMRKYKENPKIDYYKNSGNVGMAGNWNKCAMLSKADQFILLHDDDLLSPYALSCFDEMLDKIEKPWSLIKPVIQPFNNGILSFDKPAVATLCRLTLMDFSISCAVGAPTCILYNKHSYISMGGCAQDDDMFPCIDYVNSLNLSTHFNGYKVSDCVLGGYRIGENASISETVMNKYFLNNYIINIQVLRRCKIPTLVIKLVLSAYFENRVKYETEYYNMKSFSVNMDGIDLYRLSPLFQKGIRKFWELTVSLYDKFFSNKQSIVFVS